MRTKAEPSGRGDVVFKMLICLARRVNRRALPVGLEITFRYTSFVSLNASERAQTRSGRHLRVSANSFTRTRTDFALKTFMEMASFGAANYRSVIGNKVCEGSCRVFFFYPP